MLKFFKNSFYLFLKQKKIFKSLDQINSKFLKTDFHFYRNLSVNLIIIFYYNCWNDEFDKNIYIYIYNENNLT